MPNSGLNSAVQRNIRGIISRQSARLDAALDVEPEAHDVAVLDDVIRPFEAHAAGVACSHLAIGGEIGIGDRFRADKAFLEVGVDLAGCLRGFGSFLDRPGMRLLWADGEKGGSTAARATSASASKR